MPTPQQTPSPYRNWKVKQYTVSIETRLAQERARLHQPPMMSLHAKNEAPAQDEEGNHNAHHQPGGRSLQYAGHAASE